MSPEPEKEKPATADAPPCAEVPADPSAGGPAPETTPLTAVELADLKKKAAERDEFRAKMMRALADYQNLQKRIFREHAQLEEERTKETLGRMLAPLDDLDRVLATADASAAALLEGVRLAQQGFLKALAECGVEPIQTAGKPFNPQEHEAVGQEPAAGKPPGTVLREVVRGYRFRGRTLRPARVLLAAAPQKIWTPGDRK